MALKGGTRAYQAPELFHLFGQDEEVKFTKKCDVFAAGIVFLELISLRGASGLVKKLMPSCAEGKGLPESFEIYLKCSLAVDPHERKHFSELLAILNKDESSVVEFCLSPGRFEAFLKERLRK